MHVRLAREETQRDLGGAETAKRLESEHQARLARYGVVAAHEQHAQEVVPHLPGKVRRRWHFTGAHEVLRGALEDTQPVGLLAQSADEVVARRAIKPRARLVR